MYSAQLGPEQRRESLARMASEVFDVAVIGGGVTGAGAALDAATRGLSVALVEGRDYASGTSSRSSKLVHGGLRYLEQRNFALVREALRERSLLLKRLAPHLVRPVPFLFPLKQRVWERAYIGAGVALYAMGGAGAVPHHRHLTRRGALRVAPCLRPDSLVGAIQYYDAQVDDARHTMTVVRTARDYGAAAANSSG
jgi:glycerol-3-phosphate dehydrogenase